MRWPKKRENRELFPVAITAICLVLFAASVWTDLQLPGSKWSVYLMIALFVILVAAGFCMASWTDEWMR